MSRCSLIGLHHPQLVPFLWGPMTPEARSFCWHPSREWIPSWCLLRWGMVTGLPSTFTPWSLFSDFGRKSTIYWSLAHSAHSILQGGLSASQGLLYAGTVIECRIALPPCHQDFCLRWWDRWYKTRNSMNLGLTDLTVVCLTHSTVNELRWEVLLQGNKVHESRGWSGELGSRVSS